MRALLFAEEDETVVQFLTAGDAALPPLIEVAVKVGNGEIIRVVKPPDMDELWTWYVQTGNMEADPSWGKLWETSKALAANIVDGTNLPRVPDEMIHNILHENWKQFLPEHV